MKNGKLSLNPAKIKIALPILAKRYGKHLVFATVIIVLLIYILVVMQINKLASAEPGPNDSTKSPISIPKVDQDTIKHIESLEANNPQIHSLFEQARNNPFQE